MAAERCSGSLPVSVLPQDWQEIVALYEKDNTYLGRVDQLGILASMGKPTPRVLRHEASRRHSPWWGRGWAIYVCKVGK